MPRPPIFFLHNPKAGGSSLRALLGRAYAPAEVAPVFSNAPYDHRDNASAISAHCGYPFYAGHYGFDAFRTLGQGHDLITNFRDPIERIVSLYRYWRNNVSPADLAGLDPRDAAIVLRTHEVDFQDFIRSADPGVQLYIRNFHFRQLLGSPWEWPRIRPWHMAQVKRRISRMRWFYVAELPHVSMILWRAAFREFAIAQVPNENVSRGDAVALGVEDVNHLVALNRLDYGIYYHALRVQHARLASMQSHPDDAAARSR